MTAYAGSGGAHGFALSHCRRALVILQRSIPKDLTFVSAYGRTEIVIKVEAAGSMCVDV